MKKRLSSYIAPVFLAAACLLSSVSMSGCSDFGFNPIGNWKLSSDKDYIDNQMVFDERPGYQSFLVDESKPADAEGNTVWVYMGDLIYQFGKSGTGIILVDDQEKQIHSQDFTYEYTDDEVILHISDNYSRRNNLEPVEKRYKIIKDENGNVSLQNDDIINYVDDDGKEHVFDEVRILTKI